jgi:hypothetical protein
MPADTTGAESGWRLGHMEFRMLWVSLYGDLRSTMETAHRITTISECYGEPNCELLRKGFAAIDKDFEYLVAEPDEDDEDYDEAEDSEDGEEVTS